MEITSHCKKRKQKDGLSSLQPWLLSLSKPRLAFSSHQALIIVVSSMWNNKLFIQFLFPTFGLILVLCFKESLITHYSHSCVLSHLIEVFFFPLYLLPSFSLSCLLFMIEWTKTIPLFGLTNVLGLRIHSFQS